MFHSFKGGHRGAGGSEGACMNGAVVVYWYISYCHCIFKFDNKWPKIGNQQQRVEQSNVRICLICIMYICEFLYTYIFLVIFGVLI